MNNTETPILDDKNTDTESAEPSVLSSTDETLDELYSLLGDSSSLNNRDEDDLSTDSEILQPSISGEESLSVMDELEAMYGNSDHVSEDDTTVDESISVMDELEAMYGSLATPEPDDQAEDSSVSSLEELQALLGEPSDSSTEETETEMHLESENDDEINTSNSEQDLSTDVIFNNDEDTNIPDDVDGYVAYINAKYKENADDEMATESVVVDEDENLLLEETVDNSSVNSDGSSALDQLEALMSDTSGLTKEVASEETQMTENDVSVQQKISELRDTMRPSEAHRDRLKQRSLVNEVSPSGMSDAEKRFPMGILFLVIAVIGGAIIFWNIFGGGEEPVDRFQSTQTEMAENVVSVEPVLESEPKPEVVLEDSSTSDPVTEIDESPVEPPVVLVAPDSTETINVIEKIKPVWSVHLFSYHNQPPAESELEFLKKLGISYEIKQATVKGELWYRVQVFKHSEYRAAKEYADMLGKKHGMRGIWVSKSKK